ncbi:CehA/McbA family metallohydrolase [Streptosporangium sp. KLBMP 9127]
MAHYRRLRDERGWDWGDDQIDLFKWIRFSLFGPIYDAFAATGNWPKAVRAVIGDDVPAGIVMVRVDEGGTPRADVGPARTAIAGHGIDIDVVIESELDTAVSLTVAGAEVRVPPRGAQVETVRLDGAAPVFTITHGDQSISVEGAIQTSPGARLQLSSPRCARWSVTDPSGGAWFPEGVPAKWDAHHRPFFHGHDLTLAVPAGPLNVACTRGIEFERAEMDVRPDAGETHVVRCDPARVHDPAADGWYGGDLHVHMNYSGDLVCTPADAARMQLGEGLHLVNLVAANSQTSLIYDREMLEGFAGVDLPWSTGEAVAQMGVEYRNDLLGHVHALGPSAPPTRYHTGHERSDHPHDWPPNSVACQELRGLGATVGYAHPAFTEFPADGSTGRFFTSPRSVEARELVADAALGLVDSVDLISPFDDEGAVFLYHRLLSCGLRLAATAGTDTFLSFSRLDTASNPPGWGRVYAHLDDQPLSVAAFKEAIRGGRTTVTNGPWLTLEVNGQGPGAVLDLAAGEQLDIRARLQGPGADHLTVTGPDGVIAELHAVSELRFSTELRNGPTWIAAVARGPGHPNTLDQSVLAHTSPVYVDVAGRRVARTADARWCLDFLDTLEEFVARHGRFDPATRTADLADHHAVLEQARDFYRSVVAAPRGG